MENQKLVSPVKNYLEWKSAKTAFIFYDKEKKINIEVKPEFSFSYLCDFITIKGYDEYIRTGIFSNEVASFDKDVLEVYAFGKDKEPNKLLLKGTYNEIKDEVKMKGLKFCKSVYGVSRESVINLQLYGSGIGNFFDFKKDNKKDLQLHKIQVAGFTSHTTESGTQFFSPNFILGDKITRMDALLIDELSLKLQEYLKAKGVLKS